MVFNRLCDPESKLGISRWLEGTRVPEVTADSVTHQRLLRTMDTLVDCAEALQAATATLLRPLLDQELAIVFYDLTTIRTDVVARWRTSCASTAWPRKAPSPVRCCWGWCRPPRACRSTTPCSPAQRRDPHPGARSSSRLLARFPIRAWYWSPTAACCRSNNLAAIRQITVQGQPLEFILAVPARRYGEFDTLLATPPHHLPHGHDRGGRRVQLQGYRLVVAHRPIWPRSSRPAVTNASRSLEDEPSASRQARGQEAGQSYRGRKLSDGGATARFYQAVSEARLGSILKVNLTAGLFTYTLDRRALQRARLFDGKLILVSNVPDLDAATLVRRYKALADIERGFRVLKSEIEIARSITAYRTHPGARADLLLALVLYACCACGSRTARPHSPERALEIAGASSITRCRCSSGRGRRHHHPQSEQQELFAAVGLPPPPPPPVVPKSAPTSQQISHLREKVSNSGALAASTSMVHRQS